MFAEPAAQTSRIQDFDSHRAGCWRNPEVSGFLRSEKNGKERHYYPLVSKKDYLHFETGDFVKQYHENSFISLLSTLHQDKELTDEDLNDLQEWIRKRRAD